jgi:NADH:ubiquinone oxidoreductase subunit 6 (subunit J)
VPLRVNGPQWPFAAAAALGIGITLAGVVLRADWGEAPDAPVNVPIEQISKVLFEDYGVPFVIASVLLLVALLGAVILTRQEDGD